MFLFSDSFISSGTISQIFGPRKDSDSVRWYIESTRWLVKLLLLRRLYETILSWNISFTISDGKFLEILNISVANVCTFLWCIETELSFSNNCWNVELLSPYVNSKQWTVNKLRRNKWFHHTYSFLYVHIARYSSKDVSFLTCLLHGLLVCSSKGRFRSVVIPKSISSFF